MHSGPRRSEPWIARRRIPQRWAFTEGETNRTALRRILPNSPQELIPDPSSKDDVEAKGVQLARFQRPGLHELDPQFRVTRPNHFPHLRGHPHKAYARREDVEDVGSEPNELLSRCFSLREDRRAENDNRVWPLVDSLACLNNGRRDPAKDSDTDGKH